MRYGISLTSTYAVSQPSVAETLSVRFRNINLEVLKNKGTFQVKEKISLLFKLSFDLVI